MSNPFNIPPPWNAGYALPVNVADEGLERRGIVTRWAPRGTFDNPKVGHGGYAVPGYVLDEGYGEGSVMTKWAPRGTYFGPKIPYWIDKAPKRLRKIARLPGGKTRTTLAGLGDMEQRTTGRTDLTDYANSLAFNLIDTVRMMPDDMRKKELRKALDAIDPKLYALAEKFADEEVRANAPPLVALQRGIARAAIEGLGKELIDVSQGKAVRRKSQIGCAMYGLGAAPSFAQDDTTKPANGTCAFMDGKKVIWDDAKGDWRPLLEGDKCTGWQGQMRVAGFIFSVDPKIKDANSMIRWTPDRGQLPAELRQAVLTALTTPKCEQPVGMGPTRSCPDTGMRKINGSRWEPMRRYIPELRDTVNHEYIGGPTVKDIARPILTFDHPVNGKKWGMYMTETAPQPKAKFDDKNQAYPVFTIRELVPEERDWLSRLLNVIKNVVVALINFVKDAVKWVGNKTCQLLCSQYGAMAGAAAGAAAGAYTGGASGAQVGAQAGAAGADIAKNACNCGGGTTEPPPGAPMEANKESSMLTWLILGGAGAAAAYYLAKKK
jgi:hypothetical protein